MGTGTGTILKPQAQERPAGGAGQGGSLQELHGGQDGQQA